MNAEILALFQASLDEVNCLLGESFTLNGLAYRGIINDVELLSTMLDGGLLEGLATIIVVPTSQLPAAPTIGQTLRARGKIMRVEKVKTDEASHEITCKTAAN